MAGSEQDKMVGKGQHKQFEELLEKYFNDPNKNAFEEFSKFIKEVDGISVFVKGFEAINNILKYNNTYDQNYIEKQFDDIKIARYIDTITIIIASNNTIVVQDDFIEDSKYNRKCLLNKLNNKETNKYINYKTILQNFDKMKGFYESQEERECNEPAKKIDFSNLPIQKKISKNIEFIVDNNKIQDINNIFRDKTYCIIEGEGGIGKTTLVRNYITLFDRYDFQKGYAWSFYNQGEPNNQQNLIEEKQIYMGVISFFLDNEFFDNKELLKDIFYGSFVMESDRLYYDKIEINYSNIKKIVEKAYKNQNKDNVLKNIFHYIFEQKNLLIFDGMELLYGVNQPLKVLFDCLNNNNTKTKILITTRPNSNNTYFDKLFQNKYEKISLEQYDTNQVKKFLSKYLINEKDEKLNELAKVIVKNRLATPLYLIHIIHYFNSKRRNIAENDDFLPKIIIQSNRQEYSIFSYFFKQTHASTGTEDEIINFMYIASSLYKPLSDKVYCDIKKKLNTLKNHDDIRNDLEEKDLAYFDTRDKGKPYVDEGTYDIHPIIKMIFRDWLKEDQEKYKAIHNAYGEVFLDYYGKALKKDDLSYEEKYFIIDALHYYNKAKNFDKVIDIFINNVNNNSPIKKFGLHSEVFNELEKLFDTNDDIIKKVPFSLYKLYLFLSFTLGYTSKSVDFSISHLHKISDKSFEIDFNDRDYCFLVGDEQYNSLKDEEKRAIEFYDWLINTLEAIKYSGDFTKITVINEFAKKANHIQENTIILFWQCLYEKRLQEIEIMIKCKIIDKISQLDTKKFEKLLEEKYIKKELNENEKKYYSLHPHIIWRDRLIGFILDAWINSELGEQATIQQIEKKLVAFIELYNVSNRVAYLALTYLSLAKINFINICLHPTKSGINYEDNFSTFEENLDKALSNATASGKIDFLIEVYLFRVFSMFYLEKKYDDDFDKLKKLIENSNISFYKAEFHILEQAINNKYDCNELKNITDKWCYLKKRAILLCKQCKEEIQNNSSI